MTVRPLRQILSRQSMLVAGAPFLVAALLCIIWIFPQMTSEVESHQVELAAAIASQVESYLSSSLITVKGSASLITNQELSWHRVDRVLDTIVKDSRSLSALYAAGRDGRVRTVGLSADKTAHRQDLMGLDLSRNPLFSEAIRFNRPVWSDTFLSVIGGGLSVAVAVPAGDKVFFGEVELDRLAGFLKRIASKEGQIIFVIDRHGQIVADRNGRYTAQQLNISNIPLVKKGLNSSSPMTGRFDFDGRSMIGTMTVTSSNDWGVLVALPVATAYRSMVTATRIAALGLFFAVLFGIAVALYIARRFSQRFEALADHARSIAQGEDACAWPKGNIAEFEQLAGDLQQMAGEILDRERQLLKSERLLQSVMDNTFELQGLLTPDGKLVDVNRTALDLIGMDKGTLLDTYFWETPWWSHDSGMQSRLRDAINRCRAGEFVRFEATHRDKAGHLHHIDCSLKPLKDEDGAVIYLIPEGRDITDRKLAEENTIRHMENLAALRTIDAAISSSLDLPTTLNVLLEQTVKQLQADAACVLLYSLSSQMFEYAAGLGFSTVRITSAKVRLGEGYAGGIARDRTTRIISDIMITEEGSAPRALLEVEGFKTYIGVPLIAKDQIKGVLEIFHRSPFNPDQEWLEFAEALAGQAAIAIDNAELYDNLQRSNRDLLMAYDTTIEGWAQALDLRDKETEGHSRRVTAMTERLAIASGIKDEELVHVRRGALLHDIGKIGVPDSILFKPGKLNETEELIMKEHPNVAFKLLAPIAFLRHAVDIPYCHHEKWDGTGYPCSLKGEEIPLAARVFAIVDVWDALRSDRPYRKAWPLEMVRTYIKSHAGTHFDPAIVDIFLTMAWDGEPLENACLALET